ERLIESPCFINAWDATPDEAASAIMGMSPSRAMAEAFRSSVVQLSRLFRSAEFLFTERLRVVDAISAQLAQFMSGLAPRSNGARDVATGEIKRQLASVADGW